MKRYQMNKVLARSLTETGRINYPTLNKPFSGYAESKVTVMDSDLYGRMAVGNGNLFLDREYRLSLSLHANFWYNQKKCIGLDTVAHKLGVQLLSELYRDPIEDLRQIQLELYADGMYEPAEKIQQVINQMTEVF